MGYRGKVVERARARELRAQNWVITDIAIELGVSKSSVSEWVRDVAFTPSKRRYGARTRPNKLMQRKLDEIAEMQQWGRERLGTLDEAAFLAAGAALYAGEGAKGDRGEVSFANSDPRLIAFHCAWLRWFFVVDESRLRARIYLHDGLSIEAAVAFWSDVTKIPANQFHGAHRAEADPTIRQNKHIHGCCYVRYGCTRTHRAVMGLVDALLSSAVPFPG